MINFLNRFKGRISEGPLLALIMISLTAGVTYGIMIPKLGFYYDDWYMLWSGVSRGATSLISLFSFDRPFMGIIYSFFFRVIGPNIAGWHIFALIFRISGAFAFYWILILVWPKQKELSILAAMLFVVFPGFLAQPNAATKINHLIGFSGALFSIALSLLALRTKKGVRRYLLIAISMLLTMFYVWIYEYMIGLEVMRLILLFYVQRQLNNDNVIQVIKKLVKLYLPLLVGIAVFLYWRYFIFESSRNATDLAGLIDSYQSDFLTMILRLIFQTTKDFFSASMFAWFIQPFRLLSSSRYSQILLAVAVGSFVILLSLLLLHVTKSSPIKEKEYVKSWVWITLGSIIVLGAILPVVISNRFLNLNDVYKAYALHPSAGTIIILLGILLSMKLNYQKFFLVALIGFSVITQILNAQAWSGFWEIQRDFWWQLSWRAPAILENTLVMGYLPEENSFREDYEIWGPINLIYFPEQLSSLPIQAQILNQETIAYVIGGNLREGNVRDIYIPRDYSKFLLIGQPITGSCLHAFDGNLPIYSFNEKQYVNIVANFSNLSRINTKGQLPIPPKSIFGDEPEHGWCYYFQKASLARQKGDWQKIVDIYYTTVAGGFKPVDTSEYFVFVEGLVNSGQNEKAIQIAENQILNNDTLKYSLCQALQSAPEYPPGFGYQKKTISDLICKQEN
ncbi:MAG: hypothetical protein BGO78_03475 [Chloroflexi bacterium 44-23]|nr:MAG: hypothetical protein BGO78_03475 [Chloroflexi bacterium 44-23]